MKYGVNYEQSILPCGPGKDVNKSKQRQVGMFFICLLDIKTQIAQGLMRDSCYFHH